MMRKITKLMLTLAFVVLGVGGANASKAVDMSAATTGDGAEWVSGTNTFTWNAENAYVVIPGLSGDLTGAFLYLTVSEACHIDIVYNDESQTVGSWGGYGRFGSGGSKTQDLGLMAGAKINDVKEIRIASSSASGSMTITSVAYSIPVTLNFDNSGIATVNLNSLVTSGGVTFDPSTGVVTNTDGTGYLGLELANLDMSAVKRMEVIYTGEDDIWGGDDNRILKNLEIPGVNTWSGSRYSCDLTSYANNLTNVSVIKWNAGGKTGSSLTITSIKFTSDLVTYTTAGETVLNTLPWKKIDDSATETPAWNMNGSSDTYYGNYSGDPTHYVDLTDYEELRVYCVDNTTGFRCFFINADASATVTLRTADATWISSGNYYALDLSKVVKWNDKIALKAMKSGQSWMGDPSGQNVTNVVAYKTPAVGTAPYSFNGKGVLTNDTKALLAKNDLTAVDVTGMTNITKVALESANPNCLFIANANKLTNTKNVIVDGTCANLVLTDQKPFKAPAAFTAANATFTKTMTDAEYATMMIPFTAAVPEGLVARNIKGNDDDVLITELVNGNYVNNDAPVLLKGAAGDYVFTATGAKVAVADGIQDNGLLYGTYDATANVPENSYVLQKQGDEVKFFKAVDGTTVKAFRAYLDLGHSEGSLFARNFTFDFENETTGLQQAAFAPQRQAVIYNLQGQRIAQPAQGLYIKGGKKVIIK